MAAGDKVRYIGVTPCCLATSGSTGAGTTHPIALSKQAFMDWYWKTKTFSISIFLSLSLSSFCVFLIDIFSCSYTMGPRTATVMKDLVCEDGYFNYQDTCISITNSYTMDFTITIDLCAGYLISGNYYPKVTVDILLGGGSGSTTMIDVTSVYPIGDPDWEVLGNVTFDGYSVPVAYNKTLAGCSLIAAGVSFSFSLLTDTTY